jgi:hypothetical protein
MGMSKIFRASMERTTSAITITGVSSGSSTWRNTCQRLAPMTRAARMGSGGSAERPETKMRKVSGVHCHTSASTTATWAARYSDIQRMRTSWPVSRLSAWLRGPVSIRSIEKS